MFKNRVYSGSHLITDIMRIKGEYSMDSIYNLMNNICNGFGFTVLNVMKHQFGNNPKSFTILFLLSESHFSAHSYPEADAIAFDLYSCGDTPDSILNYIASVLKDELKGERDETQIVRRRLIPSDTLSWEVKYLAK